MRYPPSIDVTTNYVVTYRILLQPLIKQCSLDSSSNTLLFSPVIVCRPRGNTRRSRAFNRRAVWRRGQLALVSGQTNRAHGVGTASSRTVSHREILGFGFQAECLHSVQFECHWDPVHIWDFENSVNCRLLWSLFYISITLSMFLSQHCQRRKIP